jgi:predicted RNase H-like HicB family nuclease
MTFFEVTETLHHNLVVTSPYIPELVTQASNRSEMFTRLAEALDIVMEQRTKRKESLDLTGEPMDRTRGQESKVTRDLIRMKHVSGNQIEFTSDEIPSFSVITAYSALEGIQKLRDAFKQLSLKQS